MKSDWLTLTRCRRGNRTANPTPSSANTTGLCSSDRKLRKISMTRWTVPAWTCGPRRWGWRWPGCGTIGCIASWRTRRASACVLGRPKSKLYLWAQTVSPGNADVPRQLHMHVSLPLSRRTVPRSSWSPGKIRCSCYGTACNRTRPAARATTEPPSSWSHRLAAVRRRCWERRTWRWGRSSRRPRGASFLRLLFMVYYSTFWRWETGVGQRARMSTRLQHVANIYTRLFAASFLSRARFRPQVNLIGTEIGSRTRILQEIWGNVRV